ncbi:unnamed protein product [Caenorhabditis angaria]|uniref:Uncharacterized protein n=1 Tax=Caenorhabditis angaria TaxID=860376 RepID=A0A9P1I905_9PELO|nr:unnamed protein product [Caenorhabditis angaria]
MLRNLLIFSIFLVVLVFSTEIDLENQKNQDSKLEELGSGPEEGQAEVEEGVTGNQEENPESSLDLLIRAKRYYGCGCCGCGVTAVAVTGVYGCGCGCCG